MAFTRSNTFRVLTSTMKTSVPVLIVSLSPVSMASRTCDDGRQAEFHQSRSLRHHDTVLDLVDNAANKP